MSRRGCGGIRHLETATLWLQQIVQRRLLEPVKVEGAKNAADIGTKHVTRVVLERVLRALNCVFQSGRSKALPGLH